MNIFHCIGNTPLVEVHFEGVRLLLKLESRNPGGSAKDRTALFMLRAAEKHGLLKPKTTVVTATSGNFGISLAWLGAAMGYRVLLAMPENMSAERRRLAAACGAELCLTAADRGMTGAVEKAQGLAAAEGGLWLDQFSDPANPQAHYETTGPELWRDTGGKIDALVAGAGTGGTLCGTGRYLKEQNQNIQIIAVEPSNSPVLQGGISGKHGLQGIGPGFVPQNTDRSLLNCVLSVSDEDARETARRLARTHGLLLGPSGAAAVFGAKIYAQVGNNCGKNIAVIVPDSGERYLSTELLA